MPNDVLLYGVNFAPGMSASIGGFPLQQVIVAEAGAAQARAIVPPELVPGQHDVEVQNPDRHSARLSAGYIAIDPAGADLAAADTDLWFDPGTARAGESVTIGVNVHRSGGSGSLAPQVRFFLGDPATGAPLGDAFTPALGEGNDIIDTATDVWTPPAAGVYTITAVIDLENAIVESTKANNTVTWSLTVLPGAEETADTTPPTIDSLALSDGRQIAGSPQVTLTLAAHDQGGGAVASMYMVEGVYNNAARSWVVRQESGWVPYASSYAFRLDDGGGARYLQVWVADAAGNRTPLGSQILINYTPQQEEIRTGPVRVYRLVLAPGESVTANLLVSTGDADLYVWDENSSLVGYGNRSGAAAEQVTLRSDVGGMHQIEVYGYTDSVYQLALQLNDAAEQAQAAVSPAKPLPAGPVVAAAQEPARRQTLPTVSASNRVYLPAVIK